MKDPHSSEELRERLERYRALEQEVTDPLAMRLVHELVVEFEEAVNGPERPSHSGRESLG